MDLDVTVNGEKNNADWTPADEEELINRLSQVFNRNSTMSATANLKRINWENLAFNNRTAEECREHFLKILNGIKKYSSLFMYIEEAKTFIKSKRWRGLSLNIETKPVSAFYMYTQEKRAEFVQKNPDLSLADVTKQLNEKFHSLSPRKKEKYVKKKMAAKEDRELRMQKLRKDHPEFFGPTPPDDAKTMYVKHHLSADDTTEDNAEKREYYNERWESLKETKKIKWLKKEQLEKEQYEEELASFYQKYPEFADRRAVRAVKKQASTTRKRKKKRRGETPKPAVMLFIENKAKKYRRKNPNQSPSDVFTELLGQYYELSDSAREPFTDAQEVSQTDNEYMLLDTNPAAVHELEQPVKNGYGMFSRQLSLIFHVPSDERFKFVNECWRKLPKDSKNWYSSMAGKLTKAYTVAMICEQSTNATPKKGDDMKRPSDSWPVPGSAKKKLRLETESDDSGESMKITKAGEKSTRITDFFFSQGSGSDSSVATPSKVSMRTPSKVKAASPKKKATTIPATVSQFTSNKPRRDSSSKKDGASSSAKATKSVSPRKRRDSSSKEDGASSSDEARKYVSPRKRKNSNSSDED